MLTKSVLCMVAVSLLLPACSPGGLEGPSETLADAVSLRDSLGEFSGEQWRQVTRDDFAAEDRVFYDSAGCRSSVEVDGGNGHETWSLMALIDTGRAESVVVLMSVEGEVTDMMRFSSPAVCLLLLEDGHVAAVTEFETEVQGELRIEAGRLVMLPGDDY